ncbi:MAG: DUF2817 domain-containing protein, partial [Pseudomonadota bacterium]
APGGERLCVDTAWMGPDEPKVVLLCISGVHGPEGFCGSAAQLQSFMDGSITNLPDDVSILYVHALNPFGFSYMTRYNESIVDINRNWVDFDNLPEESSLCEDIQMALPEIGTLNEGVIQDTAIKLSHLVVEHGGIAVENALSMGQYTKPHGTGYGGEEPEWSSMVMRRILDTLPDSVEKIAYLDWHSLIHSGTEDMVYLCFNQPGDDLFKRCRDWWGADNVDIDQVDEKWSAGLSREGGRPARRGIMMWGVQNYLADKCEVAGGVIEFTDEPMAPLQQKFSDLRAMLISRYLAATRDVTSPLGEQFFKESREAWAPSCSRWQEASLVTAQRIFQRTLYGAGRWAQEVRAAEDAPSHSQ